MIDRSRITANCSVQCLARVTAIGVGAAGFAGSLLHPFGPSWGATAYLLLLATIALNSTAWLFAIPIIYSLADLYPWTGRLLVTEADLACTAIAATLLWRNGTVVFHVLRTRSFLESWAPLLVSYGVAVAVGLERMPTAEFGDNLSLYGTHLNTLRIAKGFAWGVFFAPFILSETRARFSTDGALMAGFRTAAILVALCVGWERFVTVGLLDASDPYRATGPMFSSHIGGMQIDAYWAMLLPLLMSFPQRGRVAIAWIGYAISVVLAYVAIAATMSRGIFIVAGAQSAIVVGALFLIPSKRRDTVANHLKGIFAVGIVILFGLVLMFFFSEAMWNRMSTFRDDWIVRWSHWQRLCQAADRSVGHVVFGNGMGTVPNVIADVNRLPARPAELKRAPRGESTLHLVPGRSTFVEQFVDASAPGPWQLTVHARSTGGARLGYHLCRKTLYRSFECIEGELPQTPAAPSDATSTTVIDPDRLRPQKSRFLAPPATFALSVGGDASDVDVSSVQLKDAAGHELLDNGYFHQGSDFWFFTSDDLSAWRADNIWVHLFVEQGFLGVIAFAWLVGRTLWSLMRAAFTSGDYVPICIASSILGFLAIGMIGSLVDVANLTSLLLLCIAIGQAECSPPRELAGDRV